MSEQKENPFREEGKATQEPKKENRLNSLSEHLGFDIPTEVVRLPSRGKLYPPSHPLHNQETVEIKTMTAKEEDILTSPAYIKQGVMIDKLIESCLMNKSITAQSLLSEDKMAILIGIRVTGYGPELNGNFHCDSCDKEQTAKFFLNSFTIHESKIQPTIEGENLFECELPRTKLKVQFRVLYSGEEQALMKDIEKSSKFKAGRQTNVTTKLLHSVQSINGKNDKQEISKIIMNLPAGDSRFLRKQMQKAEPSIDTKQEINCPECGESKEVDVPIGASFFFPDDDE